MQISLRSQLAAGVAALGVTAVAVTPIAQPDLLPSMQRVSMEFQLVGNPITEIGSVLQDINTNLFNQNFFPYDLNPNGWPELFYSGPVNQEGGDDFVFAPLNYGLLPDIANQFSTGALNALINNISGYVWTGIRSAGIIPAGLAQAAFQAPGAVIEAVTLLIDSQPEAALQALVDGIVAPIQNGIEGALDGVGYIVNNIIFNAQTVLASTIPNLLQGLVATTIDGASFIAGALFNTVQTAFTEAIGGDIGGALSTLSAGLLGRNGTFGYLEQLTLGPGIVQVVDGFDTVVIGSYRSVLTSELQRLGSLNTWTTGEDEDEVYVGGILNPPYEPTPGPFAAVRADASPAAATANDVETAPVVEAEPTVTSVREAAQDVTPEVVAEPATTAATADTGGSAGATEAPASVEKPAKQRVSRKAAKAAADN